MMKRGLQPEHLNIAFTRQNRQTMQAALQKLRDDDESFWNYDTSSESGFIRDAALFAAEQILAGNSKADQLRKQAHEVSVSICGLNRDVQRLRKIMRTIKLDRPKAKARKVRAA